MQDALIFLGVGLAVTLFIVFLCRSAIRRFFYPTVPELPSVVDDSIDELLTRLETLLREKAPRIADSLADGLTDEQITELERQHRIRLTTELRSLYRWHNGMTDDKINLFPGQGFQPLNTALDERDQMLDPHYDNVTQRLTSAILIGHRQHWLTVFPDWGGSGHFYDPKRRRQAGHFFYHFDEDRNYVFFPSFSNFIAYLIEAYESRCFKIRDEGETIDADFEAAMELESKYGTNTG
ncbi:MAG: SMI1/KNR4 family protein [Planctomycetota bacterium]